MTKREHDEYTQRRILQDAGFRVNQRDAVAFNSGSETQKHAHCKLAVCWFLKQQGFRVDTEVECPNGEVDIVSYGRADGDIFGVECETSPTKEVIQDKLDRYYHNTPLREVFVLNVSEMPVDMIEASEWVQSELGGSL